MIGLALLSHVNRRCVKTMTLTKLILIALPLMLPFHWGNSVVVLLSSSDYGVFMSHVGARARVQLMCKFRP